MRLLSSESVSEARIAHALEVRHASGSAGEIPGYWLLDSPALAGVLETARRLAQAPGTPILIEGERGTGVPELARLIHDTDPAARTGRWWMMSGNLVTPPDMRGWSPDGTLFIEDLESLRPATQAWLEELLAKRTGLKRPFRIIAGSRMSVADLLRHPGLRQEFVQALDVGRLVVPPLRSRRADILGLARRFLRHYGDWQGRPSLRFSEAAERKLLELTYPANVRELRNVVERAAALATAEIVGEEAIVVFDQTESRQTELFRPVAARIHQGNDQVPTLAEVERDYLVMLIREFKGRRTAIARALGVSYSTVLRMITVHRLDVKTIVNSETTPIAAAG